MLDGEIIARRLDDSRLYDGVRTRRIMAFLIDYLIVLLLLIPFAILVFFLGLLTLGLGWMLFSVLLPAVAILYVWNTLGGPNQATTGMQMMVDPPRAARRRPRRRHACRRAFGAVLGRQRACCTPLILLATLVLDRKRTVHDLLLGTVVVRTDR